ncbi:hypothetical protein ACFL7M_00295 [Thermodesulfobacteriota bacterium]
MPRGDGTRSRGQGPGTGRGTSRDSAGIGLGGGSRGSGGDFAAGPGNYCACPNCGVRAAHQLGMFCYEQRCPKCGIAMMREIIM